MDDETERISSRHLDNESSFRPVPEPSHNTVSVRNSNNGIYEPGIEFCQSHPYAVPTENEDKAKAPPPSSPVYVAIAPGLTARLRRVQETEACIVNDFYIPTLCAVCSTDLFCIMDANYVLCPQCKVVGRLEGGADLEYDGGIGIGFTWAYLEQVLRQHYRQAEADDTRPRFRSNGDVLY